MDEKTGATDGTGRVVLLLQGPFSWFFSHFAAWDSPVGRLKAAIGL